VQKITLNKTIAARRLSKTGVPTSEPEATIPFGAIVERVERDRDIVRFRYLIETYQCPTDVFTSAVDAGALDEQPAPAKPAKAAASAAASAAARAELTFEKIPCNGGRAARAKVPGGWLVWVDPGGLAFYPDPDHRWGAGS
jgi:hypothetical protein